MALWLWNDPFDYYRPVRLFEPEDFFPREYRQLLQLPSALRCPWRSTGATHQDISFDKDKFRANIDVQQFKPEEITVKVNDDTITIEGKHEEKQDEHGYISRHFVRKYVVPKGHDISKIESKLSSDGVLTITAARIDDGDKKDEGRSIPVIQTGQPSKAVEQKKEEEKKE